MAYIIGLSKLLFNEHNEINILPVQDYTTCTNGATQKDYLEADQSLADTARDDKHNTEAVFFQSSLGLLVARASITSSSSAASQFMSVKKNKILNLE